METRKTENIIYLKDLLFALLYQWKRVITVAAVIALLLGGAKFVLEWITLSDEETLKVNITENEIQKERYEAELNSLELQIETLRKEIQDQQDYLDNSIWMELDPYGYYAATISVYVQTDYQIMPGMDYQNTDRTAVVLQAYHTIMASDNFMQAISDELGTEPQYLREIMSVHCDAQQTLTITIVHPSYEGAEKLLTLVTQQLDAVRGQVEKSVTEHSVSVVEKTVNHQINMSLSDSQAAQAARLTSMVVSLANAQTRKLEMKEPDEQTTTMFDAFKQAVKFAILGGVLGAFMTAVVVVVIHIIDGKVYSAKTLSDRTGLKVVGSLRYATNKNAVDRWIYKMEGRNITDPQEQAAFLAVNIRHRCGDVGKLMVTGSTDMQIRSGLVEALKKELSGVQVYNCGNTLCDAEALDVLAQCDCVLMVEQCNKSHYDNIKQQTAVICDYGKKIIGCVLLDG